MTPVEALLAQTRPSPPGPVDHAALEQRMAAWRARRPAWSRLRLVVVAGTNGKGSTAAALHACALGAGLRAGLFTSPHLVDLSERIRVGSRAFTGWSERLPRLLEEVEVLAGRGVRPTFFEALLALALDVFVAEGVELAVVEAGVGGRSDATGWLRAPLGAVTTVALDHEARLGATLEAIARDKAGVVAAGGTLVVGPGVSAELVAVIRGAVADGVRVVEAPRLRWEARGWEGSRVWVEGRWLEVPLGGAYQAENLGTAWALAEALGLPSGGLAGVVWPGRFERIVSRAEWVLDGAHNPAGVEALEGALAARVPYGARTLLWGVAEDRRGLVSALERLAPRRYGVGGFYRGWAAPGGFGSVGEAVEALDREGAVVVVAGSLFLVGAVRGVLSRSG